jgi:hypothetical protein
MNALVLLLALVGRPATLIADGVNAPCVVAAPGVAVCELRCVEGRTSLADPALYIDDSTDEHSESEESAVITSMSCTRSGRVQLTFTP